MGEALTDITKLDALIAAGSQSGGSELANYQLFIIGLCEALGLDRPNMAQEQNDRNDYIFERRVDFKHPDGSRTAGRIDCYRRAASSSKPSNPASARLQRLMRANCS
ncbi:hypothetical protein ABID26_003515 [Mesorhizobium shonense]|uniref:MmeI-like N-terminal domain-containing protein n=1 Tax=Mesorhizobium shonense TaxID=1209948 RepID=A0ABV2HU50_9HYPH